MRPYKRAKRWIVFQLLRAIIFVVGRLPERIARAVGGLIGVTAHTFAGKDRRRAKAQMMRALNRSNTRGVFAHLGQMVVELAILARYPDKVDDWIELPEAAKNTLAGALSAGKGAIAISAHLGNWELLPRRLSRAGFPIFTAARQNANVYLDGWIVDQRAKQGITTVHRGGGTTAAREILGALKKGAIFALLIDQDTKVESVLVRFFGRRASTPVGAAELALRSKLPVLAGFIRRTKDNRHVIHIERIQVLPGDDPTSLTARITGVIEREIKKSPEQWVWFHRRWRRSPDADESS